MATKLTKASVDGLAAPDLSGKQTIVWDTELRGFGVLVSGTTSKKTYIAQRRMPDGRTRRVTVGDTAEFEKIADARLRAGKQLAVLREGRDPGAERRAAAAKDRTLRAWLDLYLKARKDLRQRSVDGYRASVERHLAGWLDRPLRELTPDAVEAKHAAIGEGAGPATANSAMRALRAIWNFAMDRGGTLPPSPTRRLKKAWFPVPPRTRVVRTEDLAKFYRAVDRLENIAARDFVKLLLFTGLRRNEAAALRWSEVDLRERVIRLPAERTKANRKLDLPMSGPVHALLVARRALGDDGPWVFGANSKSGHIEEPKSFFAQVARETGLPPVSAHDMRRVFTTQAEAADISGRALAALVNHSLGRDVTSGYVQMTTERLRGPAERVGARIAELCGLAPPAGENVAAIR